MFNFMKGAHYQALPEDGKGAEEVLHVAASGKVEQISIRRVIIVIAVAIPALFLTVFSAAGAAVARHTGQRCGGTSPASAAPSNAVYLANAQASPAIPALPQYDSCGKNPTEARSRGCEFDIMSFAWVTPNCYNETLENEFISWSNWTWYTEADPTDTTQMSFAQARLGEQDAWVDWDYHVVHCTFMWRQQHAGLETGWIGKHLVSYHHTKHCQRTLLKDVWENRDVRTAANVMYPRCLRVGMDEHAYPGMRITAQEA